MIPGDLLSAFPHRQFHTLPGILDSWAALPNSYPTHACLCREAVCTIFMMVFGMTRPRTGQTHIKFYYKFVKNDVPKYFKHSFFVTNEAIHGRYTRNRSSISIPRVRHTFKKILFDTASLML